MALGQPTLLVKIIVSVSAFIFILTVYEVEQTHKMLQLEHPRAVAQKMRAEHKVNVPIKEDRNIQHVEDAPHDHDQQDHQEGELLMADFFIKKSQADSNNSSKLNQGGIKGDVNSYISDVTTASLIRAGPQTPPDQNPCTFHHKAIKGCSSNGVLPLLVTGVGRSGTHHTVSALRRKGVDVCHEHTCSQGAVSWTYAVVDPKNFYPWEFSSHRIQGRRFSKIFHIVRHPLKTIASLTTFEEYSWKFIGKHTPMVPNLAKIEPKLRRALIHWVTWNRMIEEYADWTYRMEDTDIKKVCTNAGFDKVVCQRHVEATHKAKREHASTSWKELEEIDPIFTAEARVMAHRYGYEDALENDPEDYDDNDDN